MKTLFTLLTLFIVSQCQAQYLPSDSSFYRSTPSVTELELRVQRLEVCTQAFEKQTRVAKHLLLGSGACLIVGSARLDSKPLDGVGILATLTGMLGMTAGNVLLFDAPRVLRAEKIKKKRDH